LLAVYAVTVKEFIRDESEDLSVTMSVLDKNLKRAGRIFG
jgi:hypothetical protein